MIKVGKGKKKRSKMGTLSRRRMALDLAGKSNAHPFRKAGPMYEFLQLFVMLEFSYIKKQSSCNLEGGSVVKWNENRNI